MNIDKSDAINSRSATTVGTEPNKGTRPDASRVAGQTTGTADNGPARLTLSPALQAIVDNSRTSLTSEIDGQRVEDIRQAIADGTYHVDPSRLAERFLELETIIDQ